VVCVLEAACRRDSSSNLEKADRLLSTGQPKQAIVEYQTALGLEPNARAERGLGLAYEALAAYALAQRHLSAALEARPDDAEARVALARVLTRFGQYSKARDELWRVIDGAPDNEPALLLFGVYAETRQQMQQALDSIGAFEDRQKKLGRVSGHATLLVLADLLARTNQSEAALALRQNVRLAELASPALTLELARAAAERDSHELARELVLPLLTRHPDEADAWQILARSDLELGKLADAGAAMKHLGARARDPEVRLLAARLGLANGLQTQPMNELRVLLAEVPADQLHVRARVRRVLAAALVASRQPDAARKELGELLAESPGDVDGSLALAELALSRGQETEALEVLSKLTENHGQLARAYLVMGRAELAMGRLDEAEASFRRLWELAPHEPDAREWLAVALLRRGQMDQARRLLEGNLKRFPTHVASVSAMTLVLERSQGMNRARAFLLEHGKRHADSPELASAEGAWLLEHQDTERALAAYRRALAMEPSHFPAVAALTRFYTQHAKHALARSIIDGALAHDGRDVPVLLLAARSASDERRYDDARQYARQAAEVSPEQPAVLATLASIEAEGFRNIPHAKELALRAYAAAPHDPLVLDALGWVCHFAGDSTRAIEELELAAEGDHQNPRVLYHLGAALLAAGQPAAALERFTTVLRLDPTFPTAREIQMVLARR
jgi:tetratricopeptide (TPR) repeat protein